MEKNTEKDAALKDITGRIAALFIKTGIDTRRGLWCGSIQHPGFGAFGLPQNQKEDTIMTHEEKLAIYREIEHEFLLEDAGYWADSFCEDFGCNKDQFDLEELVDLFEERRDCNVAENDTWQSVMAYYCEGYGIEI